MVTDKIKKIISKNPDPSKWSKWIRFTIKVLLALASAILGDSVDISDFLNL